MIVLILQIRIISVIDLIHDFFNMHNELSKYIPKNSIPRIAKWIEILQIDLKFVKPRITKLGDFRYNYKNGLQITINNDLNPYQTLITLVHEIAHAFVYKKFGSKVKAHGKDWKVMYKDLMLNFLKPRNTFKIRYKDRYSHL